MTYAAEATAAPPVPNLRNNSRRDSDIPVLREAHGSTYWVSAVSAGSAGSLVTAFLGKSSTRRAWPRCALTVIARRKATLRLTFAPMMWRPRDVGEARRRP